MKIKFNHTFLSIFFLSLSLVSCEEINQSIDEKQNLKAVFVTKVIDGDTFWAKDKSGAKVKIRLIGIDAPESRKSQHKDVQYYGKEAKEYLKQLIENKNVKLEFDVDKLDQYKRTLAYVYLESDLFVNAQLIENGYAKVYTFPPNVKYVDSFIQLQKQAQQNRLGIWE
jgi:micrococcal nuclease